MIMIMILNRVYTAMQVCNYKQLKREREEYVGSVVF